MINNSIKNDTILIVNMKEIDFKFNIKKVLEVGNVLIVHLQDSIEKKQCIKAWEQPHNGVYAVDSNGDIQWNIKDIIPSDVLYTGIFADDSGNLVVNTYSGISEVINLSTRKVIGKIVKK